MTAWFRFKSGCIGGLFLLMTLFSGCTPFHDSSNLESPDQLPSAFSLYDSRPTPDQPWWESFENEELSQLIETALAQNLALSQVLARLDQANARAVIEGAARYPDLTATAGTTQGRRWVRNQETDHGEAVETYGLGLVSQYELDLWGRVRADREAAQLTLQAVQADADAAAMTIAAEVTERWLNIVAAKNRKQQLESQIATNQIRLDLVELRYQKGLVTALDVYQQRELMERTRGEVPLTDMTIETNRYELALLLGRPPHLAPKIQSEELPAYAKIPAVGLPADLLAYRPDVYGAGLRLQSSRKDLEAAKANRLPAIRLTANAQYSANKLDFLFQNWLYSLAGNLAAPLVDGGRLKAESESAQGKVSEQLAAYEETVYRAILEAETALVREQKRTESLQHLTAQLENASKGLQQAMRRYRSGLSDYLPVLAQLVTVQGLELGTIERKADIIRSRIALYRALGGNWGTGLADRHHKEN